MCAVVDAEWLFYQWIYSMQIIINQQTHVIHCTWIVAYGYVLVHVELPKPMVQSPLVGYLFLAWHSQPLPEQRIITVALLHF